MQADLSHEIHCFVYFVFTFEDYQAVTLTTPMHFTHAYISRAYTHTHVIVATRNVLNREVKYLMHPSLYASSFLSTVFPAFLLTLNSKHIAMAAPAKC